MIEYVIKKEVESISDFEAWSGGRDRLNAIIEKGLENEVTELICELGLNEETQINDFLWLEVDGYFNLWDDEEWGAQH